MGACKLIFHHKDTSPCNIWKSMTVVISNPISNQRVKLTVCVFCSVVHLKLHFQIHILPFPRSQNLVPNAVYSIHNKIRGSLNQKPKTAAKAWRHKHPMTKSSSSRLPQSPPTKPPSSKPFEILTVLKRCPKSPGEGADFNLCGRNLAFGGLPVRI